MARKDEDTTARDEQEARQTRRTDAASQEQKALEAERKALAASDDVNRQLEAVAIESGRGRDLDAAESERGGRRADADAEKIARGHGNLGAMLVNPREVPDDVPYAPARHTGTPGGKSPAPRPKG